MEDNILRYRDDTPISSERAARLDEETVRTRPEVKPVELGDDEFKIPEANPQKKTEQKGSSVSDLTESELSSAELPAPVDNPVDLKLTLQARVVVGMFIERLIRNTAKQEEYELSTPSLDDERVIGLLSESKLTEDQVLSKLPSLSHTRAHSLMTNFLAMPELCASRAEQLKLYRALELVFRLGTSEQIAAKIMGLDADHIRSTTAQLERLWHAGRQVDEEPAPQEPEEREDLLRRPDLGGVERLTLSLEQNPDLPATTETVSLVADTPHFFEALLSDSNPMMVVFRKRLLKELGEDKGLALNALTSKAQLAFMNYITGRFPLLHTLQPDPRVLELLGYGESNESQARGLMADFVSHNIYTGKIGTLESLLVPGDTTAYVDSRVVDDKTLGYNRSRLLKFKSRLENRIEKLESSSKRKEAKTQLEIVERLATALPALEEELADGQAPPANTESLNVFYDGAGFSRALFESKQKPVREFRNRLLRRPLKVDELSDDTKAELIRYLRKGYPPGELEAIPPLLRKITGYKGNSLSALFERCADNGIYTQAELLSFQLKQPGLRTNRGSQNR